MKFFSFFLSIALIALTAISCKKSDTVTPSKTDLAVGESTIQDSVSFTLNGKSYINLLNPTSYTFNEFGNKGTNLKPTTTPGEFYIGRGNTYWVGSPDSVQYYSAYEAVLQNKAGVIKFSFIRNNNKLDVVKMGSFYLPKTNEDFYKVGDYQYATDFEREGKEQGIAISFGSLKSNTQSEIYDQPTLTAQDQKGSMFRIKKITELKGDQLLYGAPSVMIEAIFEVNLFDKDKNSVKVTNGFLRFKAIEYGNRWSF
ncbi:hypothetical protein INP83_08375 [Mucilaginibacter sp. 21P]|uniref:hypothetical protein n=1 Tax=Mucilaginibacter sp. 21P TaxID=2778902 RepID=UPI001C591A9B|nr:hypothetical protein [Mucilaginibacter sp. 21P]QXV67082.1 hypothetical protein INP83_08375 [Mucilaginibacter sp. 21P]